MAQNVNLKQAKKAIAALFKHNETKPDNDMLGSEEEAGIYVEITTHKIMNKESLKKKKVALPFTPYAETMEVCYITKDDEKTTENRLKEESVTEVKKVISKKALETTYKAYEAKRKLADSYDMFLVDDRIAHLMPSLVGKKFFEKNKQVFYLDHRTCQLVLIGNFGMDQKDVLKNYEAALPNIVKITAHNWEEVQLFGIKSRSSPLLPIYAAFPKGEEKAVKKAKTEKAELPVKAEKSVKIEKSVKAEKPVKAIKVEKVEKTVKIEKKKTTTALKSQIKKRSAKK
ncbi:Ribosomal L1 domain-containing protein 1 [Choanephora cucurbitarum]|uniref:Ribosomal L1 domain-containing protein 1 n=1 Tax=Choanephora cucurbitarum TaxID=101091 RepID=A0A1C7NF84_9FUNG|nr:Ribosomal L1 domain-containing protein 1 [Choanephora cucurbitarum]